MSDSLRDQLLKAGFTQSAKAVPDRKDTAGKKRPPGKKSQTKRKESTGKAEKKPPSQRVYRPEDSLEKERLKKIRYRSIAPAGTTAPAKKARKAPAVKARAGSWSSRSTVVDADSANIQQQEDQTPRASQNVHFDEASLEALIRREALDLDNADQLYRFPMRNRITEIHVTSAIRERLVKAELGIISLQGKLFVVPADVIKDVKRTQPEPAVFLASDTQRLADDSDDADYDDFPVPDDLHW